MSGIQRSGGVTTAERYVKKLCDRAFLSLWSYPGVYRDQVNGKKVCDLLVIFENNLIIFSDKDCAFPNSGNLDIDWSRWFRRAIKESTAQVRGAERWIKNFPNRLFLNSNCSQRLPINIPQLGQARFYRVVIAHDVAERCRIEFGGGSGSLLINPSVIGEMHVARRADGGLPFQIGIVDPSLGYVHVFDDIAMQIVLETLDTISDFVAYLTKKETLINSGRLALAAGEEELLAYYLGEIDEHGIHDFVLPSDETHFSLDEGCWNRFINSRERKAQLAANEISYSWDALIEKFNHHLLSDTLYYSTHPRIEDQEKMFRILAREPRIRRRMLATAINDLVHRTPETHRATRVVLPSNPGDPYYVFLLLSRRPNISEEKFREIRSNLLGAYCKIIKLQFPDAEDIVGIATEPGLADKRSEEAAYLDARNWSEIERSEAEALQQDLGLLKNPTRSQVQVLEYPVN